ncbi:MAG: ATPase AAA [Kiloniellaceae bacterium]
MQNKEMTRDPEALLTRIREHYIKSNDFNGLPIHALGEADSRLVNTVLELIRCGAVDLVRGDGHPNPHIKALPADPIEVQVEKIEREGLGSGCLYPTPRHLSDYVLEDAAGAPFTKELELGSPQLDFRIFDLRLLEWYRNDPRYYYKVDDIHGHIRQRSGTEGADGQVLRDELDFLEFGFAYNDDWERGIAIFLRYLHDLSPDQQKHLATYQLQERFKLHPDYFRTQIVGAFPERVSIYDAFLEEKHVINEMCKLINKPPLFRTDNKAYERPHGFGILIRPTKKEYRDFALLLDQLLSDDLNQKFFKDDIPTKEILQRADGSEVSNPIGTITLLENWLRKHFRPREPEVIEKLVKGLRSVRKERQAPAHKVDDNEFDQAYVKAQRDLMDTAFDSVRTIRMALENHPNVHGYDVPDWLRQAKVWSM